MRQDQRIHVYRAESLTSEHGVYPPHLHSFYEMIYVEEGLLAINLNGKKMTAKPGSVVFFDRMTMHDLYPQRLPYRRICVQISPDFLQALTPDGRLSLVWYQGGDAARCCLSCVDRENIANSLKHVLKVYQTPDVWREQAAGYAFGLFLITLCREFPAIISGNTRAMDPTILSIKQYMEEHCCEELPIAKLASKFYLSEGYFIQCFRRATGITPKRYQMLCRLTTARSLLLSTSLPISVVALRTGFHDANSFIRFFRREMRLTPGQYRRQQYDPDLDASGLALIKSASEGNRQ